MSFYQYYEFRSVDRPLTEGQQAMLRALSSRGRVTSTSFVASYDYGDFKGEPSALMRTTFDLHFYFAHGARRFMMGLPRHLFDPAAVTAFRIDEAIASITLQGDRVVVDVSLGERDEEDWNDDGVGHLAALAPLREAVLIGDFRFFYLLWLFGVAWDIVEDGVLEPMPGLGRLTVPLRAFAAVFGLDPDLVEAAASEGEATTPDASSAETAEATIRSIPDAERISLLRRVHEGDPHVGTELRRRSADVARVKAAESAPPLRTVGMLRVRAEAARAERERTARERHAEAARRKEAEAREAQRKRIAVLASRGDRVWSRIEDEIERRNAQGYDQAIQDLIDLRALYGQRAAVADFTARLETLRRTHERKRTFVDRLSACGLI